MDAYEQAIAYLVGLEVSSGWDLKLERMRAALELRAHPERRFPVLHVAGTNGKGSTAAMLDAVLGAAGYRVALYTSPHLVDFTERIRIGGRTIPRATVVALVAELRAALDAARLTLTHFEFVTLLAFEWFARVGIDVAVIEVGLGGRLDATNAVTPEVAVITRIALDHVRILGDTLPAIAREKAGIVKRGVPVVLTPGLAAPARETILSIAAERGARVIEAGAPSADDASMDADPPFSTLGAFEPANAVTALVVLRELKLAGVGIPRAALEAGFREARWPGRFERCASEPRLWWDGAHNPEGVAALVRAWARTRPAPPSALVLALSRDKDVDGVRAPLAGLAPKASLVATRSRSERALEPERIAAAARNAGFEARVAPDVRTACEAAFHLDPAPDERSPVLLTGSLFAVGEAMEAFGGAPGEMQ